jgi:hypothetical protein
VCDGLFENGRIAGDTTDAILLHQFFELAADNEVPTNIIEPNGLSLFEQFLQRVHDISPLRRFPMAFLQCLDFRQATTMALFVRESSS